MSVIPGKAADDAIETALLRPSFSHYLHTARTASGALTAIAVGFMSLSFGVMNMGMQTLGDLAREAMRGR